MQTVRSRVSRYLESYLKAPETNKVGTVKWTTIEVLFGVIRSIERQISKELNDQFKELDEREALENACKFVWGVE